jgi:hypothetical protein
MASRCTRVGWWIVVVMVALCVSGDPAVAQPQEAPLAAEAARLRSELTQVNTQISALKRSGPSVRNDYRLRSRQAQAEALARKLTTVEAQLRSLRGVPAGKVPTATAEAVEAPAALEARADLLSDEARRLSQQASGLQRAAGELRSRQTLLRRGGQIERDPFGSMDGSKRFMVLGGPTPTRLNGRAGNPPEAVAGGGTGSGTAPPPATVGPTPVGASGTPVPTAGPGDARSPGGTTTRALLDPVGQADRRTDSTGSKPVSEIERLERAAAALNSRAQSLEAEARALRTRAAKP